MEFELLFGCCCCCAGGWWLGELSGSGVCCCTYTVDSDELSKKNEDDNVVNLDWDNNDIWSGVSPYLI